MGLPYSTPCGALLLCSAGRGDGVRAARFRREALRARASLISEACYAVVRLAARICEALQALSGVEPATEPSTGGLLAMYG